MVREENLDEMRTDVLVVGGGIAGTTAAISAARKSPNAQVTLACAGTVFGGSSFAGTTWGLGMIAPRDDADEADLVRRILEVGCGAADERLVRSFVAGIRPAIANAQAGGMRFREPTSGSEGEREYIACFDDAHRRWLGFERAAWRDAAGAEMAHLGIETLPHFELLDVLTCDDAIACDDTDATGDGVVGAGPKGGGASGSEAAVVRRGDDASGDTIANARRGDDSDGIEVANAHCGDVADAARGSASSLSRRRVCGAILFDAVRNRFVTVRCSALVLACGGTASLWPHNLSASNQATAQALATHAGATCVNLEFMQFMPAIVDPPCGAVFNEKMFRFMRVVDEEHGLGQREGRDKECTLGQHGGRGEERAPGQHKGRNEVQHAEGRDEEYRTPTRELLDMRAGYGPFSSSFASCAVDFAIADAGPMGLALEPLPLEQTPEFVETYFAWLENACGVNAHSTVRVTHRAQASNGGIRIDERGFTGVPGLFAAGEAAGGMHGANRLGGLASVSALVFGERAGIAAAAWADLQGAAAASPQEPHPAEDLAPTGAAGAPCLPYATDAMDLPHATTSWMDREGDWKSAEATMQAALAAHCGVFRTADGLQSARSALEAARFALIESLHPTDDPALAANTRRTILRLETAQLTVEAMRSRPASAGSHYLA